MMNSKVENSGFCSKRLKNTDDYLKRLVDSGQVAGVGGLVFRKGVQAFRKSYGWRDLDQKIPMTEDSIYRIFSMTKTFTVVTAMTLYEKGYFRLHDPISEFIPAFKLMKVASHDNRGVVRLVPAERPITMENLFTMTSGIPSPNDGSYSSRAMMQIRLKAKENPLTTRQMVDAAAGVALCFQPGERWMYGFSHDVLGGIIEVITGKKLGEYMAEAIFNPLELKDTSFYITDEKRSRLAKAYSLTEHSLTNLTEADLLNDPLSSCPPAFESGGTGLISTLDDIGRYGLMLLNSGKLNGERILSRKTIDLIRERHVMPAAGGHYGFSQLAGYGYGLGVRIMIDTVVAGLNGSVGEWAWDGKLGTWYCIDPEEDMVAVFLIQRLPGGYDDLPKRFAQTIYGAIDD
jgi:CubicO group peptidase (beta-lactamase class C family)